MSQPSLLAQAMIEAFREERTPTPFFSSRFAARDGSTGLNSSTVLVDIERNGEKMAPVITPGADANMNHADVFTTKEFTPPRFLEGMPFRFEDLLSRIAGENPFAAASRPYTARLADRIVRGMTELEKKIQRSMEYQAAQIMTTGVLAIPGKSGATEYTLDFQAKSSHFPTAAVSWASAATASPQADLENLAEQIRTDSGLNPDVIVMGDTAHRHYLACAETQALANSRRIQTIDITPRYSTGGATFQGVIWVGSYRYELYTYPQTYTSLATGLPVKYLPVDHAVMFSSQARFDKLGTRVPRVVEPDPRVARFLPGRLINRDGGYDITPNVWTNPEGTVLSMSLESRTLLVPTQIDAFGRLDTVP